MITYQLKKIALVHQGEVIEREIKHDLDKVYLSDKEGLLSVYRDSLSVCDNKHIFVIGKKDDAVKLVEDVRSGKRSLL